MGERVENNLFWSLIFLMKIGGSTILLLKALLTVKFLMMSIQLTLWGPLIL